jgi:hypothetical protein
MVKNDGVVWKLVPRGNPDDKVKTLSVHSNARVVFGETEIVGKILEVATYGDGSMLLTIDTAWGEDKSVGQARRPDPVIDEELMMIARLQQVMEDRTAAEQLRMLNYLIQRNNI